jgi:hypothetical protein
MKRKQKGRVELNSDGSVYGTTISLDGHKLRNVTSFTWSGNALTEVCELKLTILSPAIVINSNCCDITTRAIRLEK